MAEHAGKQYSGDPSEDGAGPEEIDFVWNKYYRMCDSSIFFKEKT